MTKTLKIRETENGTFQILKSAVDEWGKPNGMWFVFDVAQTKAAAKRRMAEAARNTK